MIGANAKRTLQFFINVVADPLFTDLYGKGFTVESKVVDSHDAEDALRIMGVDLTHLALVDMMKRAAEAIRNKCKFLDIKVPGADGGDPKEFEAYLRLNHKWVIGITAKLAGQTFTEQAEMKIADYMSVGNRPLADAMRGTIAGVLDKISVQLNKAQDVLDATADLEASKVPHWMVLVTTAGKDSIHEARTVSALRLPAEVAAKALDNGEDLPRVLLAVALDEAMSNEERFAREHKLPLLQTAQPTAADFAAYAHVAHLQTVQIQLVIPAEDPVAHPAVFSSQFSYTIQEAFESIGKNPGEFFKTRYRAARKEIFKLAYLAVPQVPASVLNNLALPGEATLNALREESYLRTLKGVAGENESQLIIPPESSEQVKQVVDQALRQFTPAPEPNSDPGATTVSTENKAQEGNGKVLPFHK